jgi:hypothetical protein
MTIPVSAGAGSAAVITAEQPVSPLVTVASSAADAQPSGGWGPSGHRAPTGHVLAGAVWADLPRGRDPPAADQDAWAGHHGPGCCRGRRVPRSADHCLQRDRGSSPVPAGGCWRLWRVTAGGGRCCAFGAVCTARGGTVVAMPVGRCARLAVVAGSGSQGQAGARVRRARSFPRQAGGPPVWEGADAGAEGQAD